MFCIRIIIWDKKLNNIGAIFMAKKKATQEEQRIAFKELYEKGKLNYIIRYGILSWGVSVTIIVRILMGFVNYKLDLEKVFGNLFSVDTIYTFITFSIFGAVWGRIMWGWLEKEVKKRESKTGKKGNNKKNNK